MSPFHHLGIITSTLSSACNKTGKYSLSGGNKKEYLTKLYVLPTLRERLRPTLCLSGGRDDFI